jgi:hypothetical protein
MGMQEGSHTSEPGNDVSEQLQTLGDQLRAEKRRPRNIAARPCQAGDQLVADRIGHDSCDDGDRVRSLLGCLGRWRAPRDNDVDLQPNQLGRQRGEPIRFPISVSPLYGQVLPLDVPEFVQALVKWLERSC